MLLVSYKVHKVFFLTWPHCQLILGHASTWKYWLNQIFAEYGFDYRESGALRWGSVSTETSVTIRKDCKGWVYGILYSFSYVRLLWLDLHFRKYFTRIFPLCSNIFFSCVIGLMFLFTIKLIKNAARAWRAA
jgi:hypothetical protein